MIWLSVIENWWHFQAVARPNWAKSITEQFCFRFNEFCWLKCLIFLFIEFSKICFDRFPPQSERKHDLLLILLFLSFL